MVAAELNKLVSQVIIIKVESSDWVKLVFPVFKSDKTVRLSCDDTINPHLIVYSPWNKNVPTWAEV